MTFKLMNFGVDFCDLYERYLLKLGDDRKFTLVYVP